MGCGKPLGCLSLVGTVGEELFRVQSEDPEICH